MVEVIRAFCWHQKFVPKGFSALAPALYTCIKSLKICIKSEFEEIILKLAHMGKVIRNFCWHQNFVPKGLSVPALGLYTGITSFKMCLKSYFREIVLKLATNGQSDKGFLLTSAFVPKGLSAPALGLYTCIKALEYIPGPGFRWAFTGPLVLWFPNILKTQWWIFINFCRLVDMNKVYRHKKK